MLSIALQGSSGHSSDPELGHNALDAMHCVMGELLAFRAQLAAAHRNPAFDVSVPTLNLGCLTAGDNPNRICDHADLQIDLRLLPGMDTDATHRGARDPSCAFRRSARHDDQDASRVAAGDAVFDTPRRQDSCAPSNACRARAAGTVAFGTEGPFLQALGMETVIFGPGSHRSGASARRISRGRAHPTRGRRADATDRRSLRRTASQRSRELAMTDPTQYARWFRDSTPYISAHRHKTFVILLGGDAIVHDNITHIVHDLALLSVLGVRVVLVHGARPQIDAAVAAAGLRTALPRPSPNHRPGHDRAGRSGRRARARAHRRPVFDGPAEHAAAQHENPRAVRQPRYRTAVRRHRRRRSSVHRPRAAHSQRTHPPDVGRTLHRAAVAARIFAVRRSIQPVERRTRDGRCRSHWAPTS